MLDLQNMDLKREIEELKKNSGKARGNPIKYLANYVRFKGGEERLKRLK